MFALLMNWMKANKILPQISDTERQALEAGKVWIDGEFFAGNPDFRKILAQNYNRLPPEEQAFLDGPVEELCRMVDRYDIGRTKRVPDEILEFIKKSGMMGFLIPKEYGGKQFSTLGISTILAKIGPVSATVGTFVVIPSSLGAAELIIHYGTQEQKNHYLPKLAAGEYVPCFGLTEPTAGSDAASIKAEGLVFRDGDGAIKLKLNFRKRYITLAPIANLATIACRLHDPQNLLGKGEDVGITCVLVHQGTPGFSNGDHHDPIGDPFYNGPLLGKDVVVPLDNIIGGAAGAGQGWRMLMEQLAGGRMVSLPAGAVGGAKAVAAVTGPYSMVRQQFGIPIGRMEGVEEKVGKIAALTYMMDGARIFGCSAVDGGIQPPVVSAVMKAYTTELARELTADGMDVFSGSGVMQGPNNILGMGYKSAPVGITVEGANIMTRTLMVFGQGATRCHPYALNVVHAVEGNDVPAFRKNLLGWIGHFILNILRSWVRYWTRGLSAGAPVAGPTARYYRRLAWAATRYAVLTDLAMFTIGGKLKVRGKLTGRYSDALAWMILATGALRRYEAEGRKAEDLPLLHYSVQYALAKIQEAFAGIYANFGGGLPGWWLRGVGALFLRLNPLGHPPGDQLGNQAALAIQAPSEQYRRLTNGVFLSPDESLGAGRLLKAFRLLAQAEPVLAKIHAAQKNKQLPRGHAEDLAQDAVNKNLISGEEAALLRRATAARLEAIEVDVFTPEQYFGTIGQHGGLELGEAPRRRAANG
ncbi:MAG TPA: acyl-CoA dehydrogenase [Nevskia sp.]|nr:acyl-CoA dehydrogenase [Nevskia sp.]